MKKIILCMGILISVIIMVTVFMLCKKESDTAVEFLKGYGWETEERPVESVQIKIPEEFDEVYNNYNVLQKDACLDLEPYKGKDAVRYTYIIKNYTDDIMENVRANVIIVDGKAVGGDISTVSIDGFMHSLNMRSEVCFGEDVGIYQ